MTFLCPDIEPSEVNSQTSRWIRVRIIGGGYGEDAKLVKARTAVPPAVPSLADWDYTPPTFRPPFLAALSLAYAYESPRDVDAVVRENAFHLDAVVAKNADGTLASFTPFVPPADVPPALYLGFDRAFSNSPFTLFLAVDEQTQPPSSPIVSWEYWNGGEWRSVGALDETKGLTQPGIVESIGPVDFARTASSAATCSGCARGSSKASPSGSRSPASFRTRCGPSRPSRSGVRCSAPAPASRTRRSCCPAHPSCAARRSRCASRSRRRRRRWPRSRPRARRPRSRSCATRPAGRRRSGYAGTRSTTSTCPGRTAVTTSSSAPPAMSGSATVPTA